MTHRTLIGFGLIAVLTGCRNLGTTQSYVVVREAQFRTEKASSDRVALPLDDSGRAHLLQYLKAGGNTRLYGKGIADLAAEKRYASVLELLSHPLTTDDLKGAAARRVFEAGPVYQVIDARERFALSDTQVVAMKDGSYWWIFYHPTSKRLQQLLVTRDFITKLKR
ncbi:MAG: hypothetical protein M3Y27_01545 [Acidobacteriota bacterium]|nr:hypothetical protein [Acidobacteriota bacterium]